MNVEEYIDFLSPDIKKDIQRVGFSRLPLVPPEIIESLSNYYNSLTHPFSKGFHPSMFWEDNETKKKISEVICNAISDYLSNNLSHHRVLYGNFMVKQPGPESGMKLHQDWSYVDEPGQESYAIWFPLLDLNSKNGALYMVPGSHKFLNTVRGPGVFCPFEENEQKIKDDFGYPLFLKKGEPVIWQHRVLHYSPPNMSDVPRVAVTAIIVPMKAPVYHYFKQNVCDVIEKYLVQDEFYYNYKIGKRPDSNVLLIAQLQNEFHKYSVKELNIVLKSSVKRGINRGIYNIFELIFKYLRNETGIK